AHPEDAYRLHHNPTPRGGFKYPAPPGEGSTASPPKPPGWKPGREPERCGPLPRNRSTFPLSLDWKPEYWRRLG
ncbi:MAG: hypothetical protein QXO02_08225, partial [Thermofilaceae archaeon]